jgi:pyrimidine deaminase RibD-like protein
MNFHDLDNYNLADAVKFHQRLNPRLWGKDEHLLPEVRDKLLAIASDFQEFLGVDELNIQDITISGSNAAYSYTPHSDIDLHLVVDMPDNPVYQELFAAKKYQYNAEHDIKIAGVPVELYVQPSDQKHVSQGIYSVKNGDWTQVPQRRRATVDDSCVQHKTADLDARIHSAIRSGDADAVNQLWDKIKTMRQTGLEQNGEFGCENIAFKLLRNSGCLGKLKKAKTAIQDRELSLARTPAPRKKMNYGMRDYWYPGTAYAGQDHPAGTESEHLDESAPDPRVIELQKELKAQGAYLGTTGPAKDGVDGIMGRLTRAALKQFSGNGADVTLVSTNTPATTKITANPRAVVVGDSIALGIAQATKLPYDAVVGRSTRAILSAAASNPEVQGADLAIVSAGTNDYPLLNGGRNNNPDATINNISRIRDVLKAKQYVWILPFNRSAARDVMSAISGDAYVDLADVSTTKDNLHPTSYNVVAKAALSKSLKEDITEDMDPNHLKKILHRFYASCVDKLQLKNPPRLRLETTPAWSQENGSFGQYEPETNTLILATSGRHVLDILRTMAHEMTHRQQDEREPLPIEAGETGSPWEDQANAMAGRIMRDWAQEQPEMFDGATLEEASGYIPTKKQAKDPRFVMALTKDVRPGAVGREANKLGLETDSQGHPALLTAGLNKLLREFKEQDLFEINMGGKNLRREAAKTGALAGMEFEMIVPDTSSSDDELEPDFDSDERATSASDIRDFFYDGDYNSRRSTQDMIDRMMDDYSDWQVEQFDARWDADQEEFIYQYIRENVDEDSIRELLDLEPEDELGKKEYQLAADMIVTEKLEPFYTDALEYSRDEFYENDNFEEWLSDADLGHMSDIFHRYNGIIHWPHYMSSLAGGTSVEDIADDFSKAVGRPTRASSGYHASSVERPAPGKNFYIVEPDGSLEPDGSGDAGLEFVSPPLPIDDIMSDLKKVKVWADRMGCYTNNSTGLHINISVPDYDLDKLDFVKLALLMGDEYVLQQFGRVGNTYAKSAMGKVRDHVQKRPYEAKYLLDKMKGHMGELASKAIHSGSTEKYTSINTKDGHIEFRSPGGDWLGDNFDKIENTLLRFTVALSAAMDPAAYREEYLKKLYKILAPKDEKDPLSIFAKYAAGELPATALKSFVRQAQADRKAKKSGEDIVNGHRWRVSLKPELGGGVVEVIAADPIDAKKQAIIQQPNWRFVDDTALTITRLDEPAAGASTTEPHPQGRGRPNDPTGRYAITRRDDQRNYGGQWGSEAPEYQFRFTLPDGYSQAQIRAVLSAWAARNAVDAEDYMIVDTTQFAAPASTAAPEESNQGNWGVWVPSLDRFATQYGNSATRRFMRHGDAQAWIQDYNTRNAGNDLELVVREIEPATAQTAAPESGSVQWNIVADDGETVHTFYNRNVQADANSAALAWVQANWRQPLNMAARGPFEVVPAAIPGSTQDLQRQRMAAASQAADAAPSMASQTRPTPIPGVQDIEPDVAQYTSQPTAPTQWEVYRRSDGASMFPLDAATQAQAWAEGRTWVQQTSNNTGITLNPADYSVRQSAQPVTESREITKLGKLDSVLERCISMIHRGQESDPEKYGRVAACLIDNKNNHTYAINLPGPDGTRRHAERVAIDTHLKRHGRIGANAIMITTLSPCVNDMSERDGESCTELLSDYGIEKCYAGWQDPTQHPAEDYPFNLQITDNADIFNTCKDIAASFLPMDMADNLNETVNPDCFDPAFNDTQHFDGLTYRATVEEEYGKPVLTIKVLDDNFQQVGLSKFKQSKKGVVSLITSFRPEYQGQGIARNIYAYVRMLGNTIVPSRNQLPPGRAMWAAWKKSGDAKHLMTDVAENFADGRRPEDKGDAKRHGINTKASVSSLRKTAKQGGRKGQLAHWLANMKAGRAKKNKTNEDTVATINLGGIIVNMDDHALDRQQQRGISNKSFNSAIRKLKLPRVINQMSQLEVGNRFYVLDHITNVALGMRKIGNAKYVLKTVLVGRPADYNIADIITV